MEPDGWDRERGKILRCEFHEIENKKLAYGFCRSMVGDGNLPFGKFEAMLNRANRKDIWSYANIPLWVVPYILLTLENFEKRATETKKGYGLLCRALLTSSTHELRIVAAFFKRPDGEGNSAWGGAMLPTMWSLSDLTILRGTFDLLMGTIAGIPLRQ